MTDPNLTDLLERASERTDVGPAPVDRIVAGALRRRRRRTLTLTAATGVLVVATVGGPTLLTALDSDRSNQTTPSSPSAPDSSRPTDPDVTNLQGAWSVHALIGSDGQSALPNSLRGEVTLTFDDDGMTGYTGCNHVSGAYLQVVRKSQSLRIPAGQLITTTKDCAIEAPLAERLPAVRHVSGSDGVRYLHAKNWMIIAELRRTDTATSEPD